MCCISACFHSIFVKDVLRLRDGSLANMSNIIVAIRNRRRVALDLWIGVKFKNGNELPDRKT
jgi:hypothetical protein